MFAASACLKHICIFRSNLPKLVLRSRSYLLYINQMTYIHCDVSSFDIYVVDEKRSFVRTRCDQKTLGQNAFLDLTSWSKSVADLFSLFTSLCDQNLGQEAFLNQVCYQLLRRLSCNLDYMSYF
jgi:hypothetical protein